MPDYQIINLLDLLDVLSEEDVKDIISEFKCPINPEITYYLQEDAISFANECRSTTYLVFNEDTARLVGYFTLAHKTLVIPKDSIPSKMRGKISRYARVEGTNLHVSAFLIAQLAKNMALEPEERVAGNFLLASAHKILQSVQRQIGGCVIFLECEDKEPLLSFYRSPLNKYKYIQNRTAKDGTVYLQHIRLLRQSDNF